MLLKDIEQYGKTAQGQAELLKYMSGKPLTRKEAIVAKCYECNLGYVDGKVYCRVKTCPLHPYMPYNKAKAKVFMSEEEKTQRMKGLNAWKDKQAPESP